MIDYHSTSHTQDFRQTDSNFSFSSLQASADSLFFTIHS